MSNESGNQPAVPSQAEIVGVAKVLSAAGLKEQVDSWVSTGSNKSVTADQITAALGEETITRAASRADMEPQQLVGEAAKMLPVIIDLATPSGRLADSPETGDLRTKAHYSDQENRPEMADLIEYMTDEPLVPMVLQGLDVIVNGR